MSHDAQLLREIAARIESGGLPDILFDNGISIAMQNGCVQFEAIEKFRADLPDNLEGQIIDEKLPHWWLLVIEGRDYTDEQLATIRRETSDGFHDGFGFMGGSNPNLCRLSPFELDGVTVPDAFSVVAGQIKGNELVERWLAYIPPFLKYREKVEHGNVRDAARHLRGDSIPKTPDPDLMARVKLSGEDIQALADD